MRNLLFQHACIQPSLILLRVWDKIRKCKIRRNYKMSDVCTIPAFEEFAPKIVKIKQNNKITKNHNLVSSNKLIIKTSFFSMFGTI